MAQVLIYCNRDWISCYFFMSVIIKNIKKYHNGIFWGYFPNKHDLNPYLFVCDNSFLFYWMNNNQLQGHQSVHQWLQRYTEAAIKKNIFYTIKSCWQHGIPWLSLTICSYHPWQVPPSYIQCLHRADVSLCWLANTSKSMCRSP